MLMIERRSMMLPRRLDSPSCPVLYARTLLRQFSNQNMNHEYTSQAVSTCRGGSVLYRSSLVIGLSAKAKYLALVGCTAVIRPAHPQERYSKEVEVVRRTDTANVVPGGCSIMIFLASYIHANPRRFEPPRLKPVLSILACSIAHPILPSTQFR